jgi:hypothetical protein
MWATPVQARLGPVRLVLGLLALGRGWAKTGRC